MSQCSKTQIGSGACFGKLCKKQDSSSNNSLLLDVAAAAPPTSKMSSTKSANTSKKSNKKTNTSRNTKTNTSRNTVKTGLAPHGARASKQAGVTSALGAGGPLSSNGGKLTTYDTQINALTYNICWGCMSANEKSKFDATARALALKCQADKTATGDNKCATNITNNIYNAFKYNTTSTDMDILALQESTNWRLIYDSLKATEYNYLGYIHHLTDTGTGAVAELCTMYNKHKFKLLSVITGDACKGRPYQIIRFMWIAMQRELIVINIHNTHGNCNKHLTDILNNNSVQQKFTKFTDGNLDAGLLNPALKPVDKPPKPHAIPPYIIFMGDTNDHGSINLWDRRINGGTGFVPLQEYKQKVSNQSERPPVASCCIPSGGSHGLRESVGNDRLYGDYVLISDNLKYNIQNIVPSSHINHNATKHPASDHLPVLSVISASD